MEDNKNVLYNKKDVLKNKAKALKPVIKSGVKAALSPRLCIGSIAALLVLTLAVGSILLPDKKFSEKENRNLAQRPAFSVTALKSGEYTSDMNTYIADQFPLRNLWIRLRAVCETAIGHYYINGVYRGDNGFLFEDITVQDGEELAARLAEVNKFAETVNTIPSYMMIVPNAASVMRDSLQENTPLADQDSYLDEYYGGLSTKIHKIDVRETFKQKYGEGMQLYYRTDHHWTTDGAYEAFKCAAEQLGLDAAAVEFKKYTVTDDFSGTLESKSGFDTADDTINVYIPQGEKDVTYIVENVSSSEKSASLYVPEKLDSADKYAVFLGGNYPLLHITSMAGTDRKLLIFKDSYANSFVQFLIPYYSEIFMVDPRYYTDDIYSLINENGIDQILFLYNANTFADDSSIEDILQLQETVQDEEQAAEQAAETR